MQITANNSRKRRTHLILAASASVFLAIIALGGFRMAHLQKLNYELLRAVFVQDNKRVGELLSAGADPNARNRTQEVVSLGTLLDAMFHDRSKVDEKQSALMYAAARGHEEIVRTLVTRGADVNARWCGTPTLVMSVPSQNVAIVATLLDHGADVNASDREGTTALMMSAWRQDPTLMRHLLDRRANVNAVDNQGRTALFFAASNGFVPHVKLLLEHGAIVGQRSTTGLTALQVAARGVRNYNMPSRRLDRLNYEAIIKLLVMEPSKHGK